MDENKKTDRRVLRTKKSIQNAFARLLTEKELSSITVKELAEEADINRKTFYNYYNDVYQVLDEIEDEFIARLEPAIEKIDFTTDILHPNIIVEKLSVFEHNNLEFYGNLFKSRTNNHLFVKIISAVRAKARVSIQSQINIDEDVLNYMIEFLIAGIVASYQTWFSSDRKLSLDDFSNQISTLVFSGVIGLVRSQKQG